MSKSLNNVYTVADVIARGYTPMELRYLYLNVQYRQKLNFTWDIMESAKSAYGKLCALLLAHKNGSEVTDKAVLDEYQQKFEDAICDDLNVPLALGVLWTMLKLPRSKDVYNLALKFDKVLALNFDKVRAAQAEPIEIPADVKAMAELRLQARRDKNWAESDRLRDVIAYMGYEIKDTRDGYELMLK